MRLTVCETADISNKACTELIQSRFTTHELTRLPNNILTDLDITGIEVIQTTRIENRLLFNRYMHKL